MVMAFCLPCMNLYAKVQYNAQGDISTDAQSLHYQDNPLNQLISDQISATQTIHYQYYATGLQASESVGTNIAIAHYYAGQGQLLDSLQGSDFAGYLRAQGLTLRTYQSQGGIQAQLFVRNRHDSVLTTISGTSAHSQQYNAYGHPLMAATSTPGIARDPLAYSSYFYDQSAGLYYLKARFYSPLYRTFLTRDSFDLSNRYFYANDNPVLLQDPSGHFAFFNPEAVENLLFQISDSLKKIYSYFSDRYLDQAETFSHFSNNPSEFLPSARNAGKVQEYEIHNHSSQDELLNFNTNLNELIDHVKAKNITDITIQRNTFSPVNIRSIGKPRAFDYENTRKFGHERLGFYTSDSVYTMEYDSNTGWKQVLTNSPVDGLISMKKIPLAENAAMGKFRDIAKIDVNDGENILERFAQISQIFAEKRGTQYQLLSGVADMQEGKFNCQSFIRYLLPRNRNRLFYGLPVSFGAGG